MEPLSDAHRASAEAPGAHRVALPANHELELGSDPLQKVTPVKDLAVEFELNACDAAREVADLAPTASCEIAPRCAGGATTELCAVEDVGHMWPGGATNPDGRFDATGAVWDFLSSYSGAG